MVTLLTAILILGIFDLFLTLLAHTLGLLDERNPVARAALGRGAASLITFKIYLTLVGCALLLLARATVSGRVAAVGSTITSYPSPRNCRTGAGPYGVLPAIGGGVIVASRGGDPAISPNRSPRVDAPKRPALRTRIRFVANCSA